MSVQSNGVNAEGVVAFRDYKGSVYNLDFTAYGEVAKKLQATKLGSKFDAEGSLDIFKERGYLTVFSISSVSAIKTPEAGDATLEEAQQVLQTIAKTPLAAIELVAAPPTQASTPEYDDIPF